MGWVRAESNSLASRAWCVSFGMQPCDGILYLAIELLTLFPIKNKTMR